MGFDTSGLMNNALTKVKSVIGRPVGAAATGATIGAVGGYAIGRTSSGKSSKSKRKNKKTGKRIKHTSRGWKQDRKRKSKQKWEVAYRRRKKKSGGRRGKIYYARKTGQPYIKLANGRAKFIKGKRR